MSEMSLLRRLDNEIRRTQKQLAVLLDARKALTPSKGGSSPAVPQWAAELQPTPIVGRVEAFLEVNGPATLATIVEAVGYDVTHVMAQSRFVRDGQLFRLRERE